MPEHTIPESLVEAIKSGRAALVVGAGIGVPSWKAVLERMTKELEAKNRVGDDATTKDLAKLLHKGSLVRSVGFLARALGEEACDRIVQDMWKTPAELPPIARAIAELPFRHVWTTFPGDVLERAMAEHRPDGWPESRVATYQDLGGLSRRRRTLVKMLGNFDTYVVTPHSVRRALARAVDLRDYARELYVEGTLVFVGFRYGDPDLSALLDRVFGMFEPPRSSHYLLGAGVGPVTIDELMAEHHIEVVNLAGKGGDDQAEKSVADWLDALRIATAAAGCTLIQTKPDADDLDGWLVRYAENDGEARDAIEFIEAAAREAGDGERLVEVLLGKLDHETEPAAKVALLREAAGVYETMLHDPAHAFETACAALHTDPSDDVTVALAERLAATTGGWSQLVAEASEIATEVTEPTLVARWWIRLGGWYAAKLDRLDYALPSYRRAIELDGQNPAGHAGLTDVLRRQQKWAELADALRAHAAVETDHGHKIDLYLQLGDLCEGQLSQTGKAVEAYEAAVAVGDGAGLDDALAALERLYRRDERWANLAKVLERRADVLEEAGEQGRVTAIRRELATLRSEKLGDLEGAITRFETALEKDGADRDALKSLVELYDKTGRSDDYLRTLERLAKVAPENERLATLRKVAAELEDKDGAGARAEAAYEGILETDPSADDAYRGLARVLRARSAWYELVALLERHIAAAKNPVQRVELCLDAATIHEKELDDPHKAIECHLNALSIDDKCKPALAALGRLYRRTEAWDKAVAILVRHAKLEGNRGAHLWAEAGELALHKDEDAAAAEQYLDQALGLDADNLSALKTQAALYEQRGAWASAIDDLLRAEALAPQRAERIEMLTRAAELAEHKLEDPNRALGLLERVLRLDPDNVAAGHKVADRLVATERWDDAVPVLEMLARHAEGGDRLDRARREGQLGRAYEQLHRTEKAAKHYRIAVESDPDNLDAALGLAQTLLTEAQAAEGATAATPAAEDRWREIDRRYREVLARHRTALADGQVADIWHRLGLTARALGDDKKAENALRRALERDPGHEPTLQTLADLGGQRGDWKMVIEAKRAMVDGADDSIKLKLLEEIGDLQRGKLKDPGTAVGAYLEALKLTPGNRALLHKLLDAYSEQKQWRRAADILGELAAQDSSPARRSKYHYAAAVIARDELNDVELAVERFSAALDDAPATPKAFDAVDKLLTEHKDWKGLARQVRKQLKRLGDDAPAEQALDLWTRLGDLYIDHLGNPALAIEAYEIAAQIDPDDRARHEQLVELYIEAGDSRRADAIRELQALLTFAPDRVELYKALSNLYREENELDKAWCLAQALVFLGVASDVERALYAKYRPAQFIPATRRLTEELWQKAVIHPLEDRAVGAIFASTLGPIAATTGQGLAAFGLDPAARTDLEHDARLVARVVKYAASVLGLEPTPGVWLDQGDGLRVANTIDRGKLAPSLLIGPSHQAKADERELAFEIGKRLAYLRPERFVTYAVQTVAKLEQAFAAALLAAGAVASNATDEAKKLAATMKQSVPTAHLEQVLALSGKLDRVGAGAMTAWRSATDLTANRAGLILANDLASAAKAIATETATTSSAPVKERLRDLLAYAVSEPYFQVRRHLGLVVRAEASA